jgi:uncharacterized membrane-anchored protein
VFTVLKLIRQANLLIAITAATLPAVYLVTLSSAAAAQSSDAPASQTSAASARAIVASLHPRRGEIILTDAQASLNLGDAYDFYDAADAQRIIVDLWGNPPQSAQDILGMVMPAGASPISDSWGAAITYEASGYVADDDAQSTDYDALLSQMQAGEDTHNAERIRQGYPAMNLVGWAERPAYDANRHSVIWAQNIRFTDQRGANSLNYDVRLLGRWGVLSLNLVSTMDRLPQVRQAAAAFTSQAHFRPGAAYNDFNGTTDQVAEFGVGGLVAAGVGVAAAQKLGLLALLAKFGKLILIGIIALAAGLRNRIAALFGRRSNAVADYDAGYDDSEHTGP